MLDPFFIDRLMHAFTTAHATPRSHAAAQAEMSQPAAPSTGEAAPCRALREAEAVVAAVLGREHAAQNATTQATDHARGE